MFISTVSKTAAGIIAENIHLSRGKIRKLHILTETCLKGNTNEVQDYNTILTVFYL